MAIQEERDALRGMDAAMGGNSGAPGGVRPGACRRRRSRTPVCWVGFSGWAAVGGRDRRGAAARSRPPPRPRRGPPTAARTYNTTPTPSNYGMTLPPGGRSSAQPTPPSATPPAAVEQLQPGLPETPPASSSGPSDRITPRSRVSQAVTTADPLLTRFALGKSNDGSTFGMFLEIFADGTIVDSEGVHHVRPADLKAIADSVNSGELYRLQGHCGAPSTDFIEYVHIVVYQRRRIGRLQAHAFSILGQPAGLRPRRPSPAPGGREPPVQDQPTAEAHGDQPPPPGGCRAGPSHPADRRAIED